MLLEFWSKVLYYLYFPDDLIVYLDVCVRLLFSLYYLPIWGIIFAILHSALESIVYTLIVPAALEVQRGVQQSGKSYAEAATTALMAAAGVVVSNETLQTVSTAGEGLSHVLPPRRLLLGSQVLESLVPTFMAPFLGQFASIDLPLPMRVALESFVVLAALIPHGALAIASCVIGHKLMTVVVEAMVDAFSRLEDGKDYPLVAARLRFVCKNPRRFTIFTFVCVLMYLMGFIVFTTASVVEYADRPLDVILVSGVIITASIVFMVGSAIYQAPPDIRILRWNSYRKAKSGRKSSVPAGTVSSDGVVKKNDQKRFTKKSKGKPPKSQTPATKASTVSSGKGKPPQHEPAASSISSSSHLELGGNSPLSSPAGPSADVLPLGLSEYDDTDGYYRDGRKRYHFMAASTANLNNASSNYASQQQTPSSRTVGERFDRNNAPKGSGMITHEAEAGAGGGSKPINVNIGPSSPQNSWAPTSSLALQERRIRMIDRFLPCPSPELVSYISGPWWETSIHRVRYMAVEALVVYFALNSLFGNGFIHSAPKAVEIMIYLNFPHLLGFLALAVTESAIRKSHSLLWLLRHPRQLPAILVVAFPYLSLLVYCTCYFFPAPLPTATLLFATVHQAFRAVELARWYEVSPQGGGIQWVELRPAAPAPEVITAALHILSGKGHRPLFVPHPVTPASTLLRNNSSGGLCSRQNSFSRQTSEEPFDGSTATTQRTAGPAAERDYLSAPHTCVGTHGASSPLLASRTVSLSGQNRGPSPVPSLPPLATNRNSSTMSSTVNGPAAILPQMAISYGGPSDVLGASTVAPLGATISSLADFPSQEPPVEFPVHDSYAIMLEDARQRGKSDLGIVGLDTAADIGLMRLYRRGQTLPSRLERRVVTFGDQPEKKKTKSGDADVSPPEQGPPVFYHQSFFTFAIPRSLLLVGAGSFSGTRFSNVRRAQKYVTWTLLSIFGLLLVALILQSVIPALQPTPMGLAVDESTYMRASLDHLIIRLTFVAKGDNQDEGHFGETNNIAQENTTLLNKQATTSQRQQQSADLRAFSTMSLPRRALAKESLFASANHSVGDWPEDSEDEYPGLCRATFSNNVSVFELSIISLLTYLPSAGQVERAIAFLNKNMDTDWRLSTSLWANGTFADVGPECWSGGPINKTGNVYPSPELRALCEESDRSRVRDWSGFFEFYDPSRDVRVIAVKGTDPTSIMDVLQDINMFFEAALYQILTGVVPFAGILPTSLASDFIRLASMTDVLSRRNLWDPRQYDSPLSSSVQPHYGSSPLTALAEIGNKRKEGSVEVERSEATAGTPNSDDEAHAANLSNITNKSASVNASEANKSSLSDTVAEAASAVFSLSDALSSLSDFVNNYLLQTVSNSTTSASANDTRGLHAREEKDAATSTTLSKTKGGSVEESEVTAEAHAANPSNITKHHDENVSASANVSEANKSSPSGTAAFSLNDEFSSFGDYVSNLYNYLLQTVSNSTTSASANDTAAAGGEGTSPLHALAEKDAARSMNGTASLSNYSTKLEEPLSRSIHSSSVNISDARGEEAPPSLRAHPSVAELAKDKLESLQSFLASKISRLPEVLTTTELSRVTSDRDYHLRVMRYVDARLASMARQEERRKDENEKQKRDRGGAKLPPPAIRDKVLLTGHSMGGAIAHIAGTRLKLRTVAFGSPGIVLSHKKFGIKDLKSVHARTFTVASSNDVVPLIGWQGGEVHHIECAAKASAAELCHVIEFMIGAMWHNCRSIRERYPKMEDVL